MVKIVRFPKLRTQITLQIKYLAAAGPVFIWCLTFSANDEWLALGCWSGEAFVYHIDHVQESTRTGVLMEAARVSREDRVYCVALSQTGRALS